MALTSTLVMVVATQITINMVQLGDNKPHKFVGEQTTTQTMSMPSRCSTLERYKAIEKIKSDIESTKVAKVISITCFD